MSDQKYRDSSSWFGLVGCAVLFLLPVAALSAWLDNRLGVRDVIVGFGVVIALAMLFFRASRAR